ncbi:MAG: glycosyltransferase family 4 protein [Bacteroidota bacterium]
MEQRRKYRFLFVSAPFSGIEVFFQNLREVLNSSNNIDTTWEFIEPQPADLIAHIPLISLNWTLKGGMVTRSRIHALERSGKTFDAALFNHITLLPFLRRFMKRTPTVLSLDVTPPLLEHYGEWYLDRVQETDVILRKLRYMVTRRAYRNAAYLLAWSALAKGSLTNDYGIREDRIAVVPPGINLKKWSRLPLEGRTAGTTTDRPKVLFVGGDFMRKGGDLLLRVARRAEFQDCEFHLVTRSFDGPVGKNVFVHSNIQANSEQLLSLYRIANIFVLPTRADFSPNAILEAMACELPVISTNVGALGEIVSDGENGYLVPADNEAVLSDRIQKLLQDEELCSRLGKNGRKLVEAKFNLEKNAAVILEYLKKAARREVSSSTQLVMERNA